MTFFDSAHASGPGGAERLLGEALADRDVVIATKGGVSKTAPDPIVIDGRRETLLAEVDLALKNLLRDRIDLFQLHRVDPGVPIDVSVAALAEAQADGRIRHIGLSNVTRAELDRPLAQHRRHPGDDGDGPPRGERHRMGPPRRPGRPAAGR